MITPAELKELMEDMRQVAERIARAIEKHRSLLDGEHPASAAYRKPIETPCEVGSDGFPTDAALEEAGGEPWRYELREMLRDIQRRDPR